MVRRTVFIAVLALVISVCLSLAIAVYSRKQTIKDVTDLMEGLREYVKTNARRD